MKWNDLTMRERAALMALFLDNNISSLEEMRHIYNGVEDTADKADSLSIDSKYRLSLDYRDYMSANEPDNYVELPVENDKYLTDDNYLKEHSRFRRAFEQYYPEAYWDPKGKRWTVGTGLTFIIGEDGKEIPVKEGDRISESENQKQLILRERKAEDYARTKSKYYDYYHPELKFQILDAMFNVGNSGVWNQSPSYQAALRKYEKDRGWEDPEYNLGYIFKHADWNLNDGKWLGLRSRMRRNPQSIVPEDYEKIYLNQYRDSLRTAYDDKYNDYVK